MALRMDPSKEARIAVQGQALTPRQHLLLPHGEQEQSEWCWAANLWMVLVRLDPSLFQCHFADQRFPGRNCCDEKPNCNEKLPIGKIAELWKHWFNLHRKPISVAGIAAQLCFDDLKNEIDAERPVQLLVEGSLARPGKLQGAGHLVLVVGYLFPSVPARRTLLIHNPACDHGPSQVAFEALQSRWNWVATWRPIG